VLVTCSSGYDQDRLHVLAFDAQTGHQLWERQFWATGRTKSHPSSANAAPTPASDGEAIFAFYSSNDLICLDLDGNLRWYRGLAYDFPKAGNDVGMSSSPVVCDGAVIVQVENQGDSFVAAIEAASGQTRWRIDRPRQANWSSPVIAQIPSGESLVLLKSARGVDAHELRGGLHRWTYSVNADGIPSIATRPGEAYLPAGGVMRLELSDDAAVPQLRWTASRVRPGPTSPIVSDDRIYAINSSGVLSCAGLQDGGVLWQLRLQGSFWATPVLAGNYLYCINDAGLAQVVDVGDQDQGTVISTSDFAEPIQGSPAVSNGSLYLRSDKSLWRIAAPEQAHVDTRLR
jgi:outer membrane protein assembly factor BamB